MSSPIAKLNLSSRDESLLVTMGFDTLEKIALGVAELLERGLKAEGGKG